jgi:hypothetical protein
MRDFAIGLVLGLVGMILWMQSFIVRELGILLLGRAHGPVDQLGLVAMAASVALMVLGPLFFWFVLPMVDRLR